MSLQDDLEKIHRQSVVDELEANRAAKRQFDSAYYTTILETTKAAIDRSRASGELVEKSATAIGGFYAAVIGVSFSVTERPISARALIPVLFLGIAIVLSMVYLAFPTPGEGVAALEPTTARPERMRRQVGRYVEMVRELTGRRTYFLRASVVALGVAVALLPAPFINDPQGPPVTEDDAGTRPRFPPPPSVTNQAEATVKAIRYQAQIDEAVEARTPASAAQAHWPSWAWIMLGAGIVFTFGIPAALAKLENRAGT